MEDEEGSVSIPNQESCIESENATNMTKYHDGEIGDKNFEFSILCNQYEKEERHVTYLENYAIEKPDVVFGE